MTQPPRLLPVVERAAMTQTPPPLGKKTKGRQRRENRRVEKKESRQVTFSKRKSGLWKKAAELAVLCRASLAIVVFSEAGKAFAFGSPSTDAVLGCADADALAPVPAADDVEWGALEALCRQTEAMGVEVAAEAERMSAAGKKVVEVQTQAGKRFWWEADVEALGEAELPVFARALQRLRDNVRRHADKMPSAAPPLQ
ncbi:hypothetical protein CFC21_098494 [Triticum aestivum]|uniref:MADS-box domain-containing protein n=2 Tax=Triticum aestivum TaxID=4565 RepID=A0A9R1LWY7_WHEAT|nr:agamous-like MADS-box protein AGL61 [Triticum dicoccoides]KAF7096572.1 hypothetical protein CFC21_098494 [Triticum aestivum]